MKQSNAIPPLLQSLLLCCQGAIVGAGAVLPGISGGVLCVAFGIYAPMMAVLAHPRRAFPQYYKLFIPFLLGWLLGFVLLAGAVEKLFEASSAVAMALFSGLIFGTIPALMKKSEAAGQSWTSFILPLAIVFSLLSFLQQAQRTAITPSLAWYVFCGAIWGLSLVIPGLSSSSILIFMGLYQPMTAGISRLDIVVLVPMLLGLLLTVLLSARLVNRLFEKRYALISRIIIAVAIASTLQILPSSFESGRSALFSAVCFAFGFVLARGMDIAGEKRELEKHQKNI